MSLEVEFEYGQFARRVGHNSPLLLKILFICKGEYRYFFPGIARELRKIEDCDLGAVTFTSPATRLVERSGAFPEIYNLASFLKKTVPRCDLRKCVEALTKCEDSNDCDTLNTMIQADRIISGYPHEQIIRILAGILEFWNEVLDASRPDAILGEIACATEWIAWELAQRREIPYLIPYPTPVANRFFFIGEPAGIWARMQSCYETLKRRRLSGNEEQQAESFVREFRAKKSKPPFLAWGQRSLLAPDVRGLFRRAARIPFRIQSYIEDGMYEVGSYHGTPPWNSIWQDSLRIVRHAFCEWKIFEPFMPQSPYIYFPLHVQPEFTTEVRAPFLANQIAVIENISKSVPIGQKIVVKEHPGMKGERQLDFYRQLKLLHNVHLVSPSMDSHDLIRNSDAVITITGSSAWEAILYEKPIIALGPLCYGFCDLIYPCREIPRLPEVIREALHGFRPNHELLLKFVLAFHQTAHKLQWGDPIRMPGILERSNIRNAATAILAELSARAASYSTELISN